ncbi:MAG: hypothetical protein ACRENX_07115 [Candidatus Dormibacteria bacterium]
MARDRPDRSFPAAAGVRIDWLEIPASLRSEMEALLGCPVVDAVSQPGGFLPGAALRLRLADDRRAFVKVVAALPNPKKSQDASRRGVAAHPAAA